MWPCGERKETVHIPCIAAGRSGYKKHDRWVHVACAAQHFDADASRARRIHVLLSDVNIVPFASLRALYSAIIGHL